MILKFYNEIQLNRVIAYCKPIIINHLCLSEKSVGKNKLQ